MFGIKDGEIKQLESDLGQAARKAIPFATRNTLNSVAFLAQREARENVRNQMITRNRWTEKSVQVDKLKTLQISRQESTVGSTEDYMETQEFGGRERRSGSEGVAIATSYSAGQSMGARPRTRLPRKHNKMQNIRLKNRRRVGRTRGQKNLIAIRQAAEGGDKFVFLQMQRKRGLFRVLGGKRNPKIRMVYDLTEQVVVIPKNPWLKPAFDKAAKSLPKLYADSLRFQLKRLGLLDG